MAHPRERPETDVQRAIRSLPAPPDPEDYELSPQPRPERILLVDDDPDIARFVQKNLAHGRFEHVDMAADGEEALIRAEHQRYDLIITNVTMPKIDGFELVRTLRGGIHNHPTLFMILSAKALSSDVFLGIASGADDYMIKPFDPVELLAHVQALLRRGRNPSRGLHDSR